MFNSPRMKALVFFFFSSQVRKIQFFFLITKKVFLYNKLHIFQFFFLKRHTYHGGFQKYSIRCGKVPEYTAIAGPRKNGREMIKTTALSTRKITSANSERKSRKTA